MVSIHKEFGECQMSNINRKLPVLFINKSECCGCSACVAICPQNAIYMVQDEEGFGYPHIDENQCVRCGLCIKVCPEKRI